MSYDNRSHPFLAQVPLTVNPFIQLPTATTLPYTYKPMPSSLPPSVTTSASIGMSDQPSASTPASAQQQQQLPRYVVSSSGAAAHPTEISAQCQALLSHIERLRADAQRSIDDFERQIKERELAEKRRVAPGWLDSEARLLQPTRSGIEGGETMRKDEDEEAELREAVEGMSLVGRGDEQGTIKEGDLGWQIDQAFGGLRLER